VGSNRRVITYELLTLVTVIFSSYICDHASKGPTEKIVIQ
jgi:hypothetical protein